MKKDKASFYKSLSNMNNVSDLSYAELDDPSDKAGYFKYNNTKFGFFDSILDDRVRIGLFTVFLRSSYVIGKELNNSFDTEFKELKYELDKFSASKVIITVEEKDKLFEFDAEVQIPYYDEKDSSSGIIKAALDILLLIQAQVTLFAIKHILE